MLLCWTGSSVNFLHSILGLGYLIKKCKQLLSRRAVMWDTSITPVMVVFVACLFTIVLMSSESSIAVFIISILAKVTVSIRVSISEIIILFLAKKVSYK